MKRVTNRFGRTALLGAALLSSLALAPAAFARDHGYRGGYGGGYHGGYYGGGYHHHGGGGNFVAGAVTAAVVGGLIYAGTHDNNRTVVYDNGPAYYTPPPRTVIYDNPPGYYYPNTYYYAQPAPVVRERVIYRNGW